MSGTNSQTGFAAWVRRSLVGTGIDAANLPAIVNGTRGDAVAVAIRDGWRGADATDEGG